MGTHLTRLTEEESMMKETGALCNAESLNHVITMVCSGEICSREGCSTGEGDG